MYLRRVVYFSYLLYAKLYLVIAVCCDYLLKSSVVMRTVRLIDGRVGLIST